MRSLWLSLGLLCGVFVSLSLGQEVDIPPHLAAHVKNAITLFDGSSLEQWRGYQAEPIQGWTIEDETLCRSETGDDIITKASFRNFVLVMEWKISEGGNSGIMYRTRLGDSKPYMSAPEYQILDNSKHTDGADAMTSSGALYGLYPTDESAMRPAGQWNTAVIVVAGNHVEHWLNGVPVVKCVMWSDDWNKRLDKSKFKGWPQFAKSTEGHIALQDHGDKVWFRNIQLATLTDEAVSQLSAEPAEKPAEPGKETAAPATSTEE